MTSVAALHATSNFNGIIVAVSAPPRAKNRLLLFSSFSFRLFSTPLPLLRFHSTSHSNESLLFPRSTPDLRVFLFSLSLSLPFFLVILFASSRDIYVDIYGETTSNLAIFPSTLHPDLEIRCLLKILRRLGDKFEAGISTSEPVSLCS